MSRESETKQQLKETLMPIIRECVSECVKELFDERILSTLVKEVASGVAQGMQATNVISERRQPQAARRQYEDEEETFVPRKKKVDTTQMIRNSIAQRQTQRYIETPKKIAEAKQKLMSSPKGEFFKAAFDGIDPMDASEVEAPVMLDESIELDGNEADLYNAQMQAINEDVDLSIFGFKN